MAKNPIHPIPISRKGCGLDEPRWWAGKSFLGWASTAVAITGSTLLSLDLMKLSWIYILWTFGNSIGLWYGLRLREKPIIFINAAYLVLNGVGIVRWGLFPH